MGAVAVSWLLFQPWVQKEALLTATLPCLPQLWALRDPLRCHPGLPSAGCCLALGLAQDRPGRVSGGPCPPPPRPKPPCPCTRWPGGLAGGLGALAPLVAGSSDKRKVAFNEGQWRGASRCRGNCRAAMAAGSPPSPRWLHPLRGKRTV